MDTQQFLKFGGVRFEAKAPPEKINEFVRTLPEEQRRSLAEVARALRDAGMITLKSDFTTIDAEMKPYLEGKRGPDDPPLREPSQHPPRRV